MKKVLLVTLLGAFGVNLAYADSGVMYCDVDTPMKWSYSALRTAIQFAHEEDDVRAIKIYDDVQKDLQNMGDIATPKEVCALYVTACVDNSVMPIQCSKFVNQVILNHSFVLHLMKDSVEEMKIASIEDADSEIVWQVSDVRDACKKLELGSYYNTGFANCLQTANSEDFEPKASVREMHDICMTQFFDYDPRVSDWDGKKQEACMSFVKALVSENNSTFSGLSKYVSEQSELMVPVERTQQKGIADIVSSEPVLVDLAGGTVPQPWIDEICNLKSEESSIKSAELDLYRQTRTIYFRPLAPSQQKRVDALLRINPIKSYGYHEYRWDYVECNKILRGN